MKKFLYLFLLVCSFSLQAQDAKWYTDVHEATEKAMKENKPLMMFFTGSDWCGWCIRLQKEVFKKEEFNKWANENVILLELDFPRKKEQDQKTKEINSYFAQNFGIQGYPTCVFVTVTKNDKGQMNLNKLGQQGYAPGFDKWIEPINLFLKK